VGALWIKRMHRYISDIQQKGKCIVLRFLLVLRRLGSLLCCSEEIGGGSTRRATSSVSFFEGRSGSRTSGFLRFRRWCYFIVLKTARKGLAGRTPRRMRRSRCGIVVALVRDNKVVVVVIRASRKTGCNSMNYYMRPCMGNQ
jgi:hypothetical protein